MKKNVIDGNDNTTAHMQSIYSRYIFRQIKSFIRFRLAFVFWAPDPLIDKFY